MARVWPFDHASSEKEHTFVFSGRRERTETRSDDEACFAVGDTSGRTEPEHPTAPETQLNRQEHTTRAAYCVEGVGHGGRLLVLEW